MEKLIKTLKNIGISDEEIQQATQTYGDDLDGFRQYVLLVRAMFDDRNQYV